MNGVKPPTGSSPLKAPGASFSQQDRSRESSTCDSAKSSTSKTSTVDAELVEQMLRKEPTDYYGILDVPCSASDDQVKKAYKKQALAFHPDKNAAPGADEAFKMVGRAFSVIGNPEKRKAYDTFGAEPSCHPGPHCSEASFVDPEEIFRAFFREFACAQGDVFFSTSSFQGGGFSSFPRRRNFRFSTPGRQVPTHPQEPLTAGQIFAQLVPIFVLIFLSFLNSLLTSY
ncbi:DnaJ [Mitosporidium daphniae]|uniref:J domain-containing protein n=1 Tax=Mitosporidium daphniae TaxID=1485682 RepID=A0A098VRS6_9MICR|nr:uncharacterized protein DI09_32p40 [Mitosporidium daphniae]KGG51519.1 hypothetical protein DI09_32p40 [Mitosporidium daphniae]|eukprot:XP_013237971.1 uncharacterized protein DI09_32p40 [Mitosporidium daphniae]